MRFEISQKRANFGNMITFLSDFGTHDYYVAAVKAHLLRYAPSVPIVDITHQIRNSDLAQAAFTLRALLGDFPSDTIHLVAVDTHAARNRHLLLRARSQFFLLPDNGLAGLLFDDTPTEVYTLHLPENYAPSFPAKTLYAPVALALLQGSTPHELGERTDTFVRKHFPAPLTDAQMMRGNVIHVDHYGNLFTNMYQENIETWSAGARLEVRFAHERVQRICQTFAQVDYGDCLVFYDQAGRLGIGIRQGNAAQLLGMRYNSSVLIEKLS